MQKLVAAGKGGWGGGMGEVVTSGAFFSFFPFSFLSVIQTYLCIPVILLINDLRVNYLFMITTKVAWPVD